MCLNAFGMSNVRNISQTCFTYLQQHVNQLDAWIKKEENGRAFSAADLQIVVALYSMECKQHNKVEKKTLW